MAWRTESASKISIGRIGMSPPDKPMAALCGSKLAAARFRSFAGGNDSRDRNPQKPGRRQSALGPNPYLLAAMRLRPSGISGNERPLQPNGNACRPERPLTGCIPFFWSDRRATNPPISKLSPAIVLNAAFEVDQSVAPAFGQRHFGLLVKRNGTHAPQKLGRRQSTLAPDADRLAAMRLRPSEFWKMNGRCGHRAMLAVQNACQSLNLVAFRRSASGLRLNEGPHARGLGETKDPAAAGRLCRLTARPGEASGIMAVCDWKRSESGRCVGHRTLPFDLRAWTKCAVAPQMRNLGHC